MAELRLLARLLVVAFRFLTGRHLDGRARSDSTFWTPGREPLSEGWWGSRGSWWAMLAGKHRLALRLACVAVFVGLWRWRHATEWALALAGGPAVGWLAWRACRAAVLRGHLHKLERPLAAALAPYLGVSPLAVEASLAVRPDYADADGGEHLGELALPDHWAATPDQRRQVEDVISARFGVELRYQWRTASHPMALNLTRAPVPPALVPFAGVREAIEACAADRVLLGKTADGSLKHWDSSSEDPHIAIHGGSRRGKTALLLLIAAQELRKGAERVTAIDPKRVSLLALAGCGPAVELRNDPRDVAGMWDAIGRFRALVEDRYDQLAADPTAEFARALLIIDEVSQFSAMSAAHWRHIKERTDPALPPVWEDVAACVWMGAQARAHVIVAGQRLDYQLLGGMLGSFGVRLLAGFQPLDYARLVGVPPVQRSQKPRGRFLVYAGGELDWVQLVYAEPDELRAWVLAGRAASDLAQSAGAATSDVLIGLAAGAGYLGLSVDAFRKRRERVGTVPGEFRSGNQPAWRPADLDRWAGREVAEVTG